MTTHRDNSLAALPSATANSFDDFIRHFQVNSGSVETRRRSPKRTLRRTLARFLKTLGSFSLVIEEGRIRSVWTSNLRHRNSISRAILNRPLADLITDSSLRRIARAWKAGWNSGRSEELIIEVLLPDGPHVFVLASMPLASSEDGLRSACILAHDITDVRKSRAELQKSETLLNQAEELAQIGSWDVSIADKKLYWSKNHYRVLGLPEGGGSVTFEEALSLIHPEDRERAVRDADITGSEGTPLDNELRFVTRHRGERIFHSRAIPVRDETGKVVRVRGMSQDVTEQRLAEQSLRKREAALAAAEQIANAGSYEYDCKSGEMQLSANLREIWGFTQGREWNFDDYWSFVHPEDRQDLQPVVLQAVEENKPIQYVNRYNHPKRGMRYLQVIAVPVADAPGGSPRRVGVVRDITERQLDEMKIREREELLAAAEEIANFGSYQSDYRTRNATMSPNLRKIYGLGPNDKWSRKFFRESLHPQDRDRVLKLFNDAVERPTPFEYVARYMRTETDIRILHVRGVPIFDKAGRLIKHTGVVQDITDHARAEENLRRLSQQLLNTRDQEQRRIARQLHETVGQSLAALNMTLGRIQDTAEKLNGPSRALLSSAKELTNEAVREVRTVSYLMHPPLLDEAGLGPALRWYARGFAERSGIGVDVGIPDDLPRSPQEAEITVYRIVQEALTNVHRYSGSRTAQIRVGRSNGDLVAEIRDEGCGIVLPSRKLSAPPIGVGIAGMRERVRQLDGALEIDSIPGRGTTVRATIPVGAKPALFLMPNRES